MSRPTRAGLAAMARRRWAFALAMLVGIAVLAVAYQQARTKVTAIASDARELHAMLVDRTVGLPDRPTSIRYLPSNAATLAWLAKRHPPVLPLVAGGPLAPAGSGATPAGTVIGYSVWPFLAATPYPAQAYVYDCTPSRKAYVLYAIAALDFRVFVASMATAGFDVRAKGPNDPDS